MNRYVVRQKRHRKVPDEITEHIIIADSMTEALAWASKEVFKRLKSGDTIPNPIVEISIFECERVEVVK